MANVLLGFAVSIFNNLIPCARDGVRIINIIRKANKERKMIREIVIM